MKLPLRLPSSLMRGLHMAAALYNLAFVYTPLHGWEHGLAVVQGVTMPLLALTGLLLYHRRKQAHRLHRSGL